MLFAAGHGLVAGRVGYALLVLAANFLGSLVGAAAIHGVSRRLGSAWLTRIVRLLAPSRQEVKLGRLNAAHLSAVRIAVARVTPGLLMPSSVVAGAANVDLWRFAAGVVLGEALWSTPFVTLGAASHLLPFDVQPALDYLPWFAGGAAALAIGYWTARLLADRKRAPAAAPAPQGGRWMKMTLAFAVASLLAVLLAACGSLHPASPSGRVPFNVAAVLGVGESAMIEDGFTISFVGVVQDSRCPSDVVCVRAGDATARVRWGTAEGRDGPAGEVDILLGVDGLGSAHVDGHLIGERELRPYPKASQPTRPGDYTATFYVARR
ncbi:MAG: VTT domain-containing protein [SAR202 cluster bacterium]|nr:VTT domain-containing protein [SAR202 cluster bacterium]